MLANRVRFGLGQSRGNTSAPLRTARYHVSLSLSKRWGKIPQCSRLGPTRQLLHSPHSADRMAISCACPNQPLNRK